MARKDDFSETVKRKVAFQSHGICQYRNCSEVVVSMDDVSGEATELGRYAHILPASDGGPRAEYRARYPDIRPDSFQNCILLCSDHHDLIDREVDQHPPEILSRMKSEKSILNRENIVDGLEQQSAIEIEFEDYKQQFQLSAVLLEFSKARSAGPRLGAPLFRAAEATKRTLERSPFKKGEAGEVLLNTEYFFTRLFLTYKRKPWSDAYQHTTRVLRLVLPEPIHFHLLSSALVLVRDEYGVFRPEEKTTLISQIVSFIDEKMNFGDPRRAAFLLLIKSALLRWRGRFERGVNQRNTNAEALRCCERSLELSGNPGCSLQKALINYSSGLAFQLHEAPKHEPFFTNCLDLLESPELADFPAAIKYRPRFYREIYKFEESIKSFWSGAARYPAEFKRVAFLIGEAATGEYNHHDQASDQNVSDAKAFLELAIGEGYNHGRNIISYIYCRGILEPDWFKTELLDNLFGKDDSEIKWEEIVARVRNALYDPKDKYDEPSFGLDGGEFWSTLGGVTGRILQDHERAIRLFQIAAQHAEVSGGKFRAYLGLALQYREIGNLPNYRKYVKDMRTVARAHHQIIFDQLENE